MTLNNGEKLQLQKIADEKGISFKEAHDIIDGVYAFAREKIEKINFTEKEFSKEEIENMKTNFNIPCLGKLCVSYPTYKRINKIK